MRSRKLALLAALALFVATGAAPPEADPGVFEVVVPESVARGITEAEADALLERAAGFAPASAASVRVMVDTAGGLVPLDALLPAPPPVPEKEPPPQRSHAAVDHPGAGEGQLSGRAVYLSQCHGYIWFDSLDDFSTQRGNIANTVEDLHNPEGANQFLARYLENAGAAVFTVKERDLDPRWAVVDDGGPGYREQGSGFVVGAAGYAHRDTWEYGQDPFGAGTTRRFPADGGAVASWTPDVPADGSFAVYVSWDSDPAHARDAHYRIRHPGGAIHRWFDQTVHGSTWQYVDTLWLPKGSGGLVVELVADSSESGHFLSADAVRVGGGSSVVSRHGELSGRPRWEEGAIQAVQFNGAPTSVYDPYGDGSNGSDPSSRSRWADWEHPAGEDAVFLSWHSNASDGAARGTVTYVYDDDCTSSPAQPGSFELASAVQDELVSSFRVGWEAGWQDRGVKKACFAEVNRGHNDEMPAVLVELAFHDNLVDVEHLKHPVFRQDAARAMYRGIVRYFADRDGEQAVFLPEAPVDLAFVHGADSRLELSWRPGLVGEPYGDAPASYVVWTSVDGRSWGPSFSVDTTATVVPAELGDTVYVRVAAVNDGGMSFPSEVVAARRTPHGAPVLVVAAFDRFQTSLLPRATLPRVGEVVRMDLPRVNGFDNVAAHGRAIAAAGWGFDAISDERLPDVDLSAYRAVVWAAGEESTADDTFSADQQALLRAFVESGGTLWVSGAEVLWDLDEKGSAADRAFAAEVLGAGMASDDAGTTRVGGEGLLADVGAMDFAEGDGAPYPVEWPDSLDSALPVVARYGNGEVAGVLGDGVFLLGFPFETIGDESVRVEVARRVLKALVPDWTWPDTPDGPGVGPGERVPLDTLRGCGCAAAPRVRWAWLMPAVWLVTRRRRGHVG